MDTLIQNAVGGAPLPSITPVHESIGRGEISGGRGRSERFGAVLEHVTGRPRSVDRTPRNMVSPAKQQPQVTEPASTDARQDSESARDASGRDESEGVAAPGEAGVRPVEQSSREPENDRRANTEDEGTAEGTPATVQLAAPLMTQAGEPSSDRFDPETAAAAETTWIVVSGELQADQPLGSILTEPVHAEVPQYPAGDLPKSDQTNPLESIPEPVTSRAPVNQTQAFERIETGESDRLLSGMEPVLVQNTPALVQPESKETRVQEREASGTLAGHEETNSLLDSLFRLDASSSASNETEHDLAQLFGGEKRENTDQHFVRTGVPGDAEFGANMTGVNQQAVQPTGSVLGREQNGSSSQLQPAAVKQLDDAPVFPHQTRSVTLDLDPLDMGPLRLRVMMTDHTVHAHIRTEHGGLAQGLLQQGHQLESSLRTTGLEMGFLRVTVDQQQQGRGQGGWEYQQPGYPAARSQDVAAQAGSEERSGADDQRCLLGRVSLFA